MSESVCPKSTNSDGHAWIGLSGATTTGTSTVTSVPGALTPVTIRGASGVVAVTADGTPTVGAWITEPDGVRFAESAGPKLIVDGTLTVTEVLVGSVVLLTAVFGLGVVAILLGADGNYDLRNYHFYIGWAMFNKPVGYDVAAAQIQSYNHPLMDGLFYQLWRVLNDFPRVFTFVWSIPQAIAVWLVFLIAREIFAEAGRARTGLALAAAFIAADGAVSIGVIGTSMSEGILNALLFGGVLLVLRDARMGYSPWRIGLAGLMAGAAVGLKLTAAPYLIGFGAALLLAPGFGTAGLRIRRLVAIGAGATISLAVIGGPWWWVLYVKFGNPLFPLYNALFNSPDYGNWNFVDNRFFPRTAWQWVFYPLEWTLRKSTLTSEEPVRDARIGVGLVAALLLIARRAIHRYSTRTSNPMAALSGPTFSVPAPIASPSDMALWCGIWTLSAYVLWLKVFSILRYASALEVMSGIVIVAGLHTLLPFRTSVPLRIAGGGLAAVLLLSTTVYPTWERRPSPGASLLTVSMPHVPSDSLTILLVATPASYIAAFMPPSVHLIGVNNSMIHLNSRFGLQNRVEQLIRDNSGPIWGVDKTDGFFGMAEQSLVRYRLRRTDDCKPIESNVDTHLRICRLERVD